MIFGIEINKPSKNLRDFLLNPSYLFVSLCSLSNQDRIDYKNMGRINRFISEQEKILFRRVNRLTLKQQ